MLKESYYTEPTEMDTLIFEKLVPPDHYLRRVKQCLDFERFRDLLKDCYSPALGRTAEDPVRILKLAFLQFHYRLSDREVVATAQVNVAFRFFLDLSLASRLPVPSLLTQFRTRVGVERHQALFDQLVPQAREQGFALPRFVSPSPLRGETEPAASLVPTGQSPLVAPAGYPAATVPEPLDPRPEPSALSGLALSLTSLVRRHSVSRGCPAAESDPHEEGLPTQPADSEWTGPRAHKSFSGVAPAGTTVSEENPSPETSTRKRGVGQPSCCDQQPT